jgi:hypothetical protein
MKVSRVIGLLSVTVLSTLSSATLVSRHYSVYQSFDNKIINTNGKAEHNKESLIECCAMCHQECFCFGFNSRTKKCRIFSACLAEDVAGDDLGWKYYYPVFPGKHYGNVSKATFAP